MSCRMKGIMKAVVVFVLGLMLFGSCLAVPRKLLEADNTPENGSSTYGRTSTDTHRTIPIGQYGNGSGGSGASGGDGDGRRH
jgi:hypothetical protein